MSEPARHSLLRRQLKRHFGPGFAVPQEWAAFVAAVDAAYQESDQDRGMLERSLELSSQELLQASAHMRALLQGIPDLLLRLAPDGKVLEKQAGAGAEDLAGLAAFFGGSLAAIPDRAIARQYEEALARAARDRAMVRIEHSVLCPEGECFLEARLVPLPTGDCLAIVRNITEAKRAESSLSHTVSVLRSILEATADGILVVDLQGRICSYNRRFAELWRIPVELVEARNDAAVLAAGAAQMKDPEGFARRVEELYRNPEAESFDVIEFEDGRVFERASRPQRLDGVPVGRVWSFHDVTARRRTEERLLKLSRVVEQTAESVLITNAEGNIEYINPAFTALTGYELADVLGRNPRLLKSGEHDCDFYQELWDTILAGQIFHAVLINRKKDGELYHADSTITPIKDGAGRITHFVSTEQDITSHRELEAQLRHAQKMEAFGQLAAGVAHDFNNLLTVIIGNAAILDPGELGPAAAEGIAQISQAAERAANLTQQLLTFGRRRLLQPVDLDVNQVLTAVSKILGRVIGEHIALDVRCTAGGAPIHADPGMIEQVIMNLAVNARDAMPGGGRLSLATGRTDIETLTRDAHPLARPGKFVSIEVKDTGSGIAPEHLPQIFEPFFTTKDVGEGTGLGLATVFSIVEQHRGWLEVESEVGKGSTFRVMLPRIRQVAEVGAGQERARGGPRGDECILLVEDEEAVRKLMRHILETHGYRVLAAPDGPTALGLWGAHASEIALLVTDMILPGGIGGAELARRLVAEKPDLRVLYCSGYSDDMLREDSPLRHGGSFVGKPFVPERFLQQVRERLDTLV